MSRGTKDLLPRRNSAAGGGGLESGSSGMVYRSAGGGNAADPRPPASRPLGYTTHDPAPPGGKPSSVIGMTSSQQRVSNTTGAGSGGGGGGGGMFAPQQQHSQPMSDDALFGELQTKVMAQKRDLDDRTDNVNAIQRNFQRLSDMYSNDRKKLEDAERVIAQMREELESLRAEKKLFSALQVEFAASQTREEKQKEDHQGTVKVLHAEMQALAERLRTSEGERKALQKTMKECGARIQTDDTLLEQLEASVEGTEGTVDALLDVTLSFQRTVAEQEQDEDLIHKNSSSLGEGLAYLTRGKRAKPPTEGSEPHYLALNTRVVAIANALALLTEQGIGSLQRGWEQQRSKFHREYNELDSQYKAEIESLMAQLDTERNKANGYEQQLAGVTKELKSLMRTHEVDRQRWESLLAERGKSVESMGQEAHHRAEAEAQLKGELIALGAEHSAVTARCEELEHQLASLQAQSNALQEEAADRKKAYSALQDANRQLERELKYTQQELTQHATTKIALEKDLVTLKQEQHAREKKWVEERQALLEQLEASGQNSTSAVQKEMERRQELEKQNQELQRELSAAEEKAKAELGKVVEQWTASKAENTQLHLQLSEAQKELSQAKSLLEASNTDATGTLKFQREAYEQLRQEFDSLQEELLAAQEAAQKAQSGSHDALLAAKLEFTSKEKQLMGDLAEQKRKTEEFRASLLTANDSIARSQARLKDAEEQRERAQQAADVAVREAAVLLRAKTEFEEEKKALESQHKLAALRAQQLRIVEEQCAKTVKKVLAAEEACESGYSCQLCFDLFKEPIICAPCGHTYCRKCFETNARRNPSPASGGDRKVALHCPECELHCVKDVIESHNLDLLSGKFEYRRQQLTDLVTLLDRELKESSAAFVDGTATAARRSSVAS